MGTSSAKKLLEQCSCTVFDSKELWFDYSTHTLVPRHEALTKTEANAVLSSYHLTREQLPKLLTRDPIVRFYNWSEGTVVKVTKIFGGVVEPYVSYRVVHG